MSGLALMASTTKHIHFIGICGTAMGSTAVALRALGHQITGSDEKVYPPMSDVLRDAGIAVTAGYKPENLPLDADVYVVGNAISRGNEELETLLEKKLPYVSMAEMLKREVIQGKRSFVVSGTHGKTTTTTMLAWIFEHAGKDPGFMIGGVPENFESGARFTHSDLFVIEGDEYDTAYFDKRSKFLHYLPECAIVNNIEFDHADIFNDLDEILLSFRRFLNTVPALVTMSPTGRAPRRRLIPVCSTGVVQMKANVGSIDRIARFVLGVILILAPFASGLPMLQSTTTTAVSVVVGAILVATAAMRFCPLYRVLGMNTCKL